MYAAKAITATEWLTARQAIEDRVRVAERDLATATDTTVISDVIGRGAELKAAWPELGLDRQVAIVRAVVDHVVVEPVTKRDIKVDPARITPVWRL